MELDTRELFRYLARDCNYRDEKLCDVSKADCIARDYILLSKLRSSWRFLKFSEALHVYSNRNLTVVLDVALVQDQTAPLGATK